MPDPMTGFYEGPPRRRNRSVDHHAKARHPGLSPWKGFASAIQEKVRIVEETYLPGNSVSLVASRCRWPVWGRCATHGLASGLALAPPRPPQDVHRAAWPNA